MRQVDLPGTGERLPAIGQGTWGMGEAKARFAQEVEALQCGLELGMTLIDTAEFYAGGGAERVVGAAIRGVRDRVFIVSKVWPSHAGFEAVLSAIQGSLDRLGTDYLDAALLHWPTRSVPFQETWRGFAEAVKRGWVRHAGVSNFSGAWLKELAKVDGMVPVRFNEVPYRLSQRALESEVRAAGAGGARVVLAYSPLGHGRMGRVLAHPVVQEVARKHGVSAHQAALSWVVRGPGVVALPKAVHLDHVRSNAAAGRLALEAADLKRLDTAFPVPSRQTARVLPPYQWMFQAVDWGVNRRFRS